MIFADKLIDLRKRSGLSQEELAEKMNVSRQSVSKWEGAQSVPDINKMIALSEIFGVSTDYLLKDEIEAPDLIRQEDSGEELRRFTLEEANDFLEKNGRLAASTALGTFLCIISVIPMISLGVIGEIKKIELLSGAITNDIQNKLSVDSSYEVNTPNSTMSVLGTVFYVSVYEKDGVKYTKISVFSGRVSTKLKYEDGTYSDEEVVVESGKETIIYYDGKVTDYVGDPSDIDYGEIPEQALKLLAGLAEEGREISITSEELDRLLYGPYEVVFMYRGTEFGRQTVKKGEKVRIPDLQPEATGEWDYDFAQPVNKDLEINWK